MAFRSRGQSMTRTCVVSECPDSSWYRGYCAKHYKEHCKNDTEAGSGKGTISKMQNIKKVYASKTCKFGFGQKFISPEGQVLLETLKDVTSTHKSKEDARRFNFYLIKSSAKIKNLFDQGFLNAPELTSVRREAFALLLELGWKVVDVLQSSTSPQMNCLTALVDVQTIQEIFSLVSLEAQFQEATQKVLAVISPYVKTKTIRRLLEVCSYYGGLPFWTLLVRNALWVEKRAMLLSVVVPLLEPMLLAKCAHGHCHKAPLGAAGVFRGSTFCLAHHSAILACPLTFFFLPGGSKLPSFRNFTTQYHPLKAVLFTVHQALTEYKATKDKRSRTVRAMQIVRNHLQSGASAPVAFSSPEEEEELLKPLITAVQAQEFSTTVFQELQASLGAQINDLYLKFLQSKPYLAALPSSVQVPDELLQRHQEKEADDAQWCDARKLDFPKGDAITDVFQEEGGFYLSDSDDSEQASAFASASAAAAASAMPQPKRDSGDGEYVAELKM